MAQADSVPPRDFVGKAEVTGASLIAKFRMYVQPPGRRGSWLRYLSDKRLAELYHRLRHGQSPVVLSKVAQENWNVMKLSDPKSLARAIRDFRDRFVSKADLVEVSQPPSKEKKDAVLVLGKRGQRIADKLDDLGVLRWAILEHAERYAELRTKEGKLGMPLKMTNPAFKELVYGIDRYVRLQMDLGLRDSKPSEFNINLKHKFDGLLGNLLTGDGTPMLDATATFIDKLEEEVLSLELNADGSYQIINGKELVHVGKVSGDPSKQSD